MQTFEIRREPGTAAVRRAGTYGHARTRLVMRVSADGYVDALAEFIYRAYLRRHNRQYVGSRIEFKRRGEWTRWATGDPLTESMDEGRDWRCVVTLANGRATHETSFVAWRAA